MLEHEKNTFLTIKLLVTLSSDLSWGHSFLKAIFHIMEYNIISDLGGRNDYRVYMD